jgi:type I restriction enzyme, S subunit
MRAGWHTEKLGEVCSFLNRGISPKYIETSGICVLNQKCIRDHRVRYELARRHDLAAKSVSENRFIQLGDVLVNSTGTGTLGRVAQVREAPEEPTTVDSHVTIVRPKQGMFYQDFFGYMLILIEEAIKEAGEGCGGQTELARSVLAEKFLVSYPTSIEQQQRIVAILDKAFEGIAKAHANAEQNLQNARALFESHLQSIFSVRPELVEGRGEGWVATTLGEVCDVVGGGTPSKANENYFKGNIFWATVRDMKNELLEDTEYKITLDAVKNCSTNIIPKGNVVIATRVGLGKVCLLKNDTAINQDLRGIVPKKPNTVNVDFLFYWFKSNSKKIIDEGTGATVQGVKLPFIKSLPINIPIFSEQTKVAGNLIKLTKEIQRLEVLYQRKIACLDELKKSLLQQAFAGEL